MVKTKKCIRLTEGENIIYVLQYIFQKGKRRGKAT